MSDELLSVSQTKVPVSASHMGAANTESPNVAQPVKIYFDGSYIPPENEKYESEMASIGYAIFDCGRNQLAKGGKQIHEFESNTDVEFRALIEALERTIEIAPNVEHICIMGDARSVIDLIDEKTNHTPRKNHIKNRLEKVQQLTSNFEFCSVRKTSRDLNEVAHKPAAQGYESFSLADGD